MTNPVLAVSILLLSVLSLSCSGGFSGASSGSSIIVSPVISGKVTNSSTTLNLFQLKSQDSEYNGSLSLSGCTVNALSLQDNSLIASTTSDSDGNYYLTGSGVVEGENYKISAVCSGDSFTSVGQAVRKSVSAITDADRIPTNPRSTIISAYIVKAIVEAVQEAVSSISDTAIEQAVKASMYENMGSIIASIESNVNEAIDSGAMQEPTASEATSIASAVNSANESTSSSNIDSSLSAANIEAPPTVTQAVTGAKNSAGSLTSCHPVAGSYQACSRAIAKIMHNNLSFNILIEKESSFGQVSAITSCVGTHVVDGSITLADEFPQSTIAEASTYLAHLSDYCIVKSNFSRINRNAGYEDIGYDDGGVLFAETGNMDLIAGDEAGLISAVAQSMYSQQKYNLSSLNNMVFNHQNNAGFNAKLVNKLKNPLGETTYSYKNSSGNWVSASWPVDSLTSQAKEPSELDLTLSSAYDWSTATGADQLIAASFSNADFTQDLVFHSLYSGTIPSQEELNQYIDEDKIHLDYNPSGPKELYVMTNDHPGPGAVGEHHPCYDDDPTTPCLDAAGAELQGISVGVTYGVANINGVKPLTNLNVSGADFYLRPIYGPSGFDGLMHLIKASDGRALRDEELKKRVIKVILNTNECGNQGIPAVCAEGDLFNAHLDWSSCGAGACPSYTVSSAVTGSGLNVDVKEDYRHNFSLNKKYVTVGVGGVDNQIKVLVLPQAGDDLVSFQGLGEAEGNSYNLATYDVCIASGCTFSGFILIDDSGVPYHGDADASNTIVLDGLNDVAVYSTTHINIGNDFDPETAATSIQDVALIRTINNAPVVNESHSCNREPFFIDGNGNSSLDCGLQTIDRAGTSIDISVAVSGDVSFSSRHEYERWLNDPFIPSSVKLARSAQTLHSNENGFHYEDPIAVSSLLSTAFGGKLNGSEVLNGSSELNALQAFSLVFMFFQNTESKELPNLGPGSNNRYTVVAPFDFAAEDEMLKDINDALARAFDEFKIN